MRKSLKEPVSMMYHRNQSNIPAASYGVFDPRGSRQMDMQACPLGSLPAEINLPLSIAYHKKVLPKRCSV